MPPKRVQQKSPYVTRAAAGAAATALVLAVGTPIALAALEQDAAGPVGGERLARPDVQVAPLPGAPALPSALSGRSWLVADATTGEVLAARNAHLQLPPASTLKMLFADTVMPKFDRSLEHQVTPAELANLGAGSSLVGVKENLPYRVEDLWRGVFLSSGNDAVHVLAHMNGGIAQTVAEMQARAGTLQAKDTKVVSPDGYDMDGQVSSAYDLTLFARAGLRNADFRSYCATRTARFPGGLDQLTGQRTSFDIANTDRLLGKYPGLIGVKNGYTTNAGATFTGAAERDGRTLLVTVMHPEAQGKVYDEAASLLDWGFAAAGKVQPVGQLVEDTAPPASAAASSSASAKASSAPEAAAASQLPPWGRPPVASGDTPGLAPALWTGAVLATALAAWATAHAGARRRAAAAPAVTVSAPQRGGARAAGGSSGVGGRSHRRLARRARALVHSARSTRSVRTRQHR
ncbi:D-alanyl-D-alanine carboxypeptidase (penicillin-binding protein 5/6) [Streptomyces sp. 1114.5]|uniref:D-alanyl-D-alanine carboxypeptidase family protein n=1 Tax=Streptomyces sp. 1114.5 TaxID=1938830 RepID=UPI000F2D41F4|nr:D-alanyl-D-alanine carboxypeptidase (penicillin-binding protein 5/6) [Streptomyces sp. 1114.5]